MAEQKQALNYFQQLNAINVNDKTEKKAGLTYLSWAWAWAEVKKLFPNATYFIYERNTEYGPVNYFTDGRTCWVKTGVIIGEIEHIEELPVMDFKNRSIPLEAVTSMDVNKAIQRSLTKACARHGLGLYIYAGEDLPEGEDVEKTVKAVDPTYDPNKKITKEQAEIIAQRYTGEYMTKLLSVNKIERLEDMTALKAAEIIRKLNSMQGAK